MLSWIDVLVLIGYLIAAVALGVWVGRGNRDLGDYLLGGRNLPWWALMASIVATETSTATFLSVPGIAYAEGGDLRFFQLTLGYLLGRILVTLVLMPGYFRGQIFSAYEVLEHRFGRATRVVASLLFLVARNLGDGLRLLLTALALGVVFDGMGLASTIDPRVAAILVIGLVTIGYTLFGGMKSVVWNDGIQMLIYLLGGLVAAVVLVRATPEGLDDLLEFGERTGRLRVFDFSFSLSDPLTFWGGLLGGLFLTAGTHGTDQMMVQRYLCARNQGDASKALIGSALAVMIQFALFLMIGVGLASFYRDVPTDQAFANDEVFARFIVDQLPVGLVGLTLAAMLAAAMSTLSSSLNSSASALVSDFYHPWRGASASQGELLMVSRASTVLFGLIQIGLALAISGIPDQQRGSIVSNALAIAGFVSGPLLGAFVLGIVRPQVGQRGALIGMITGLAVVATLRFGPEFGSAWTGVFGSEFTLGWTWFPVFGTLATLLGGLATPPLPGLGNPTKSTNISNKPELDSGEKNK